MSYRCRMARLVHELQPRTQYGSKNCFRVFFRNRSTLDHYKTLGVSKNSTKQEIREAYVKLSKKHHPDAGGCSVKFAALNQAYQVLSSEISRRAYDAGCDADSTGNTFHRKTKSAYDVYGEPGDPPPLGTDGYYGIKGLKRVTNGAFALICLIVVIISGATQVGSLIAVSKLKADAVKRRTEMNMELETASRNTYELYGIDEAIRLFEEEYELSQKRKPTGIDHGGQYDE